MLPWQSGQSGHPRPESVTRTTPPSVIWPTATRIVPTITIWKALLPLLPCPRPTLASNSLTASIPFVKVFSH